VFEQKEAEKQRVRAFFDAKPHQAAWLRRPESKITELGLGEIYQSSSLITVETEIKYAGYIAQQDRQVNQLREAERRKIPASFAYGNIPGLSREVQEKLSRVKPETLGQAGKIPGVTPAAVAVLDVYLSVGHSNGGV